MKKVLFFLTCCFSSLSYALATNGPKPWQMDFRPPATPTMEMLVDFHNFVNPIIIAIAVFVIALMTYIAIRFSAKNNPKPTKTINSRSQHTAMNPGQGPPSKCVAANESMEDSNIIKTYCLKSGFADFEICVLTISGWGPHNLPIHGKTPWAFFLWRDLKSMSG